MILATAMGMYFVGSKNYKTTVLSIAIIADQSEFSVKIAARQNPPPKKFVNSLNSSWFQDFKLFPSKRLQNCRNLGVNDGQLMMENNDKIHCVEIFSVFHGLNRCKKS